MVYFESVTESLRRKGPERVVLALVTNPVASCQSHFEPIESQLSHEVFFISPKVMTGGLWELFVAYESPSFMVIQGIVVLLSAFVEYVTIVFATLCPIQTIF